MRGRVRRAMKKALGLAFFALVLVALFASGCSFPDPSVSARDGENKAGLGFHDDARATTDCAVRTSSYSQRSDGDAVVLKAQVKIYETPSGNDRWRADLEVIWDAWPQKLGLLGDSQGGSPGDGRTHDHWVSTPGEKQWIHDELSLRWDHEDFQLRGEYGATVVVSLEHQTHTEKGWKTVCHQSGEADAKIVWEGGSIL